MGTRKVSGGLAEEESTTRWCKNFRRPLVMLATPLRLAASRAWKDCTNNRSNVAAIVPGTSSEQGETTKRSKHARRKRERQDLLVVGVTRRGSSVTIPGDVRPPRPGPGERVTVAEGGLVGVVVLVWMQGIESSPADGAETGSQQGC